MHLEQMEIAVDLLDQVDLLSEKKDGTDAAGAEPLDAIGRFILDIGRGHHWYGPLGPRQIDESFFDSSSTFLVTPLIACLAFFSESSTHSKASFVLEL